MRSTSRTLHLKTTGAEHSPAQPAPGAREGASTPLPTREAGPWNLLQFVVTIAFADTKGESRPRASRTSSGGTGRGVVHLREESGVSDPTLLPIVHRGPGTRTLLIRAFEPRQAVTRPQWHGIRTR